MTAPLVLRRFRRARVTVTLPPADRCIPLPQAPARHIDTAVRGLRSISPAEADQRVAKELADCLTRLDSYRSRPSLHQAALEFLIILSAWARLSTTREEVTA